VWNEGGDAASCYPVGTGQRVKKLGLKKKGVKELITDYLTCRLMNLTTRRSHRLTEIQSHSLHLLVVSIYVRCFGKLLEIL
jgi:hypothetical protein